MNVSLKWLSDLFLGQEAGPEGLQKFRAQLAPLKEKLPLAGLEIGSVRKTGEGIEDVIVGQIVEFAKHPKADRLNVCKVKFSEKEEALQIVCGAPNVRAQMKVALARVGSVLPGEFKIKEAKIRDVESFGMLCSEKELGLSEASEGIMDLPASAPLGSKLSSALGLDDEIWEIELTPDRGDCLSHWGVAREVSRYLNKKPRFPDYEELDPGNKSEVPLISVEVQAPKACLIYGAQLIEGLENGESPEWMRHLLESLGTRSHDVLVDITNFVLLELGQPMHAFDADKIRGSKIIVRYAKKGEKLKTLDGIERELHPEDLVIADLEGPMALAGVMGGEESAVSRSTRRIVLETAVFDPDQVRATAKRHLLHSDSSHRFERGIDASMRLKAAGRATQLIRQLTGAKRRGSYIEILSDKIEKIIPQQTQNFDLRAFKNVVGMDASAEEICELFTAIEIPCQIKSPSLLRVEIPAHRYDLDREIDLVEEAARLVGYNRVPVRYPPQKSYTENVTTSLYRRMRQIRHRFVETGLSETMPYCFVSKSETAYLGREDWVDLENPLSQEWTSLRPNLSFGLLKVLARHAALGQNQGGFFDLGHVFTPRTEAETQKLSEADSRQSHVKESVHGALALLGRRLKEEHWSSDKRSSERRAQVDFFDAKGYVENLVHSLSAIEARWGGTQFIALQEFFENENFRAVLESSGAWIPYKLLHPGRSAILTWPAKPPGLIVGYVGELHPSIKSEILNLPTGLELGAALAELRIFEDFHEEMAQLEQKGRRAPSPAGKIKLSRRLPIVERDLALVVSSEVKAQELEKTMSRAAGSELLELRCVDLFQLEGSKKSLAFRACLQGQKETLKDHEIQELLKRMLEAAQKKHGAELR